VASETSATRLTPPLLELGLSRLQQFKQQASATYTQQIDTGTQKEQTAFETKREDAAR